MTINSPVYAKPTGRSMGNFASHSAALYIQDIEVCDIPDKVEVEYKFSDYRQRLGKGTLNLKRFFESAEGLDFIVRSKVLLDKCIKQAKIQNLLNNITSEKMDVSVLRDQTTIDTLIRDLMEQFGLSDADAVRYLIQIVDIVKIQEFDTIQKSLIWKIYQDRKTIVDNRLREFNTTGLDIRAKRNGNKLIISFGKANRMSNGERDVLNFVASLIVFESKLNNKPGILIIDEVFDYLDGANLLAAQYYLSQMMKKMKTDGKKVFPIIMTHLDPAVFSNYSFKGMAVHYLTNKSKIDLNDDIVKMLLLRNSLQSEECAEEYEKYLLHYHPDNWTIPTDIKKRLPEGFFSDSFSLREWLYREVEKKYLLDLDYNAPAVIIATRMKVEEKTVELMPEDKRAGYYDQHGSKKKFLYAEDAGADLPELFYLLQPLYNDPAHLRSENDKENRNKIESAYLKISSPIVKMMIREVFQM